MRLKLSEIKIVDYLKEYMVLDVGPMTKESALELMIERICQNPTIRDGKRFKQAIFARECLMSTGIGYEIAIPHARLDCINDFAICILRCKDGIPYESIDDLPVKIIFMIAASDQQEKEYIKFLSHLMVILKSDDVLERLFTAPTTTDLFKILNEAT